MKQPERFVVNGKEKKVVCKLVKSLYGLNQTPKQWHEKSDNVMLSNEFKINKIDKCVYVKNTNKSYVIVCIYVDDILILDNNDWMIKSIKKILTNKFDIKDLSVANVIVEIKVSKTSDKWYCPNLIMLRKFSINFLKMTVALSKHQLI